MNAMIRTKMTKSFKNGWCYASTMIITLHLVMLYGKDLNASTRNTTEIKNKPVDSHEFF